MTSLSCPTLLKWLALLACAWSHPAHDNDPPAEKKITVTVIVVLASERGEAVPEELKCFAEAVRTKYPTLKSFRIGPMTCKHVAENERVSFRLPEKQKLIVEVHCASDPQKKVCLTVIAPTLGEIEYGTVCAKFLPIVTRYYTSENERLLLAVRVQPCPCPKK